MGLRSVRKAAVACGMVAVFLGSPVLANVSGYQHGQTSILAEANSEKIHR